jgi:hypothetical protein
LAERQNFSKFYVIEFSDDSFFFVSGGKDGRLLLWPENQVLDSENMFIKPTAKKLNEI